MKKEDIAKALTDLLIGTAQDVVDADKLTVVTPDVKTVDKAEKTVAKSVDEDVKTSPTLDEIINAIVPKLSKELKLNAADGEDGKPDKTKINEAVKETLKNLGFTEDDLDIDMVIKKKRKGEAVDDDGDEVIFKSKHEAPDTDDEVEDYETPYQQGVKMTKEKRELNKQLNALSKEDRKKALGQFIRGCI
jgi:hypothetical protein